MSDSKSGSGDKGGFGPRKPKATFGDVMLGIPSGRGDRAGERGGERKDGPQQKPSRNDKPRRDRDRHPARKEARPSSEQASTDAPRSKPAPKERKPQGPLVVVKRATGAIESRPLEEKPPEETTPQVEASAPVSTEPAPTAAVSKPAPTASGLYDEVHEHQSFAELYESSSKEHHPLKRPFRVGEKVHGKIFQLGADTAFVSLGGKSEAMIELSELKDEGGILRSGVGDEVEAYITEVGAKGIILSKSLGKGAASLAMLSDARLSGIPVEGLVLSVNKGGLEVAVGDARAFCPSSQIDVRFVDKPDQFIGEKLKFRVMEVRERNVVLSRRALLEEEQKALAAETRKKLAEGAVLKGTVTSVRDFGAFIDLGGMEGMAPVSELAHVRVSHPSEVVKVGDEVEVEVLKIEPPNPNSPDKAKQKERITLSLRARQEDPWKAAAAELQEGARIAGKVVRLQPFGAFVEIKPGVDGLIHISALSDRRIAHPRDVVKVGQEVQVAVEKMDPVEKRIGLRLVREDGQIVGEGAPMPKETPAHKERERVEPAPRPKVGQVVTGKVDRIEPFGVFLAFAGGRGLVPASETGTERGSDLKRHFQMGQELKALILEMDHSGKIRLSLTAAQRAEERAEIEDWKKSQPKGTGGKGFGTFADLLRAKIQVSDDSKS